MRFLRRLTLLLGGSVATAQAQTFAQQWGTQYYAPAINNTATLGYMLAGMQVTGRFTDGTVLSGTWSNLGSGIWGVLFSGRYRLAMNANDDTWSMPLYLTVYGTGNTLASLSLNGGGNTVVFDRTFGNAVGTAGSSIGWDFGYAGSDAFNTLVTYANAVSVVGASAPVGDIFEQLTLDFRLPLTGSATGRTVTFYQDIDNIVNGTLAVVPEPAAVALLAAGLLPLLALTRRRRAGAHR